MRNLGNKEELFHLLANSILNVEKGLAYATLGSSTVCNRIQRKPIRCNHEEGDTKIFVHLKHAIENDLIGTASIQANDTDIIILSVALFHDLFLVGLREGWVAFGKGRDTVWYPIHKYAIHHGHFSFML